MTLTYIKYIPVHDIDTNVCGRRTIQRPEGTISHSSVRSILQTLKMKNKHTHTNAFVRCHSYTHIHTSGCTKLQTFGSIFSSPVQGSCVRYDVNKSVLHRYFKTRRKQTKTSIVIYLLNVIIHHTGIRQNVYMGRCRGAPG